MFRPLSILLAALAAALALAAPASAADGPRLAFVEWLDREPPMTRIGTVAADGSGRRTLDLGGVQPLPFEGPVWSADGSTLLFSGYPLNAKGEIREKEKRLYLADAEGGMPRELPRTAGATDPVLSPDGGTVAFTRSKLNFHFNPKNPIAFGYYSSSTAWTVALDGGRPKRLTPWRNGLANVPAAFSPDGSTLLLERDREPGWDSEVVARPLGGGPLRVIARRAEQPDYSPDGTRIALIDYRDGLTVETGDRPAPIGELYVVDADGSRPQRLTRTKTSQESQPDWSPSGERIAFLRIPGPGGLGFGSTLMQMNSDGSCLRRVTGGQGRSAPALYGPAWQPGPGREALRLTC